MLCLVFSVRAYCLVYSPERQENSPVLTATSQDRTGQEKLFFRFPQKTKTASIGNNGRLYAVCVWQKVQATPGFNCKRIAKETIRPFRSVCRARCFVDLCWPVLSCPVAVERWPKMNKYIADCQGKYIIVCFIMFTHKKATGCRYKSYTQHPSDLTSCRNWAPIRKMQSGWVRCTHGPALNLNKYRGFNVLPIYGVSTTASMGEKVARTRRQCSFQFTC